MAESNQEELKMGEKVIGGPRIYFWVISILAGIGTFSLLDVGNWMGKNFHMGPFNIPFPNMGLPLGENTGWVFLALYVAALVGLYMRKGWAVPVGRAALVVSMVVLFPVGTIFGAILWKRFNDPVAKKYLNYGAKPEETPDKESQEKQDS